MGWCFLLLSVPELNHFTSCALAVDRTNINTKKSYLTGGKTLSANLFEESLMEVAHDSRRREYFYFFLSNEQSSTNVTSTYHMLVPFNCILKVEGGKTWSWHDTNSHPNLFSRGFFYFFLRRFGHLKLISPSATFLQMSPNELQCLGVWKVREVTFVFCWSARWRCAVITSAQPSGSVSLCEPRCRSPVYLAPTWTSVHFKYLHCFSLSLCSAFTLPGANTRGTTCASR